MIQAIQTPYNGIFFRSRAEARWAVWFDQMDVPYDYEPQGFTDGKTSYLPDFSLRLLLPEDLRNCAGLSKGPSTFRVFFEVKGDREPTSEEIEKARMLATGTGTRILIAFGSFSSGYRNVPTPVMLAVKPDKQIDGLYIWKHCPSCNLLMPRKLVDRMPCKCEYPYDSSMVTNAYKAAKSARFGVHDA